MEHVLPLVFEHLDEPRTLALEEEIKHVRWRQAGLCRYALVARAWRGPAQMALLCSLLFDARSTEPNWRIGVVHERLEAADGYGRVGCIVVPGAASVHLEALRPIVARCRNLRSLIMSTSGDFLPVPPSVRTLWVGVPTSGDFARLTTLPNLREASLGDHRGGAEDPVDIEPLATSNVTRLAIDVNWGLAPAFVAVLRALEHVEVLVIETTEQEGQDAVIKLGVLLMDTSVLPKLRSLTLCDGHAHFVPRHLRHGLGYAAHALYLNR